MPDGTPVPSTETAGPVPSAPSTRSVPAGGHRRAGQVAGVPGQTANGSFDSRLRGQARHQRAGLVVHLDHAGHDGRGEVELRPPRLASANKGQPVDTADVGALGVLPGEGAHAVDRDRAGLDAAERRAAPAVEQRT